MARPKKQRKAGQITMQQLVQIFGVEPGTVQRWISFGLPVEYKKGKLFDLAQVAQWIVVHLNAGYLSLNQCAEMFGVEPRTITKWRNEFGAPQSMTGFYRRNDIVQWREKYLGKKLKELQQGGPDGMSANARLKNTKEARERLKLLKETRQLVDLSEVMPVFIEALMNIRTRGSTFGQHVAPKLEGMNATQRSQRIQKELNVIFTELAIVPDKLKRLAAADPGGTSESPVGAPAASGDDTERARGSKERAQPGSKRRARKVSRR